MKTIRTIATIVAMMTAWLSANAQETKAAKNNDSVDVCQFVVAYDYRINTFDKHGAAVVDSMRLAVLVGTKGTKCMDFYKAMSDDFDDYRNREWWEPEYAQRIYNIPVWCINYPEGEMTTFDKVVPHRYMVHGKAPRIDWTVADDTLTVGGFLCQKAVGEYAGRRWTAWFTEEIAAPVGPWKLRGLPGLILKASDAEGIHTFTFCGLLNKQCAIRCRAVHGYGANSHTQVEQAKFVKYRNKILTNKQYVHNPRYYLTEGDLKGSVEMWAGGPEPAPEDKLTVFATDLILPKTAHVYQPLELK